LNNRHCEKSNKSRKKFCPTNEQVGEQCCFFGQIENDALDNKSCLFESSAFKNSSKMTISCVFFNNRLLKIENDALDNKLLLLFHRLVSSEVIDLRKY
jgi:hypothetical protein